MSRTSGLEQAMRELGLAQGQISQKISDIDKEFNILREQKIIQDAMMIERERYNTKTLKHIGLIGRTATEAVKSSHAAVSRFADVLEEGRRQHEKEKAKEDLRKQLHKRLAEHQLKESLKTGYSPRTGRVDAKEEHERIKRNVRRAWGK